MKYMPAASIKNLAEESHFLILKSPVGCLTMTAFTSQSKVNQNDKRVAQEGVSSIQLKEPLMLPLWVTTHPAGFYTKK